MKFHWFAEVTHRALPDTFPAPGQGAWVDSPIDLADPERVGEDYRMFIRLMQQADRDGFDGLAVNEHHQTPFAMTPSPNLLAASVAGSTENAAVLVIGDSLALYNPPTRVAEELAYLDCLSGGRVIPQLRDLWADHPDHWTPAVSQRRIAARAGVPTPVGGH